jgi:hypothetical protein
MDPRGLCARIIAKHPSWNLLEKRVADVRGRALADGRLRRPDFEAGLRPTTLILAGDPQDQLRQGN